MYRITNISNEVIVLKIGGDYPDIILFPKGLFRSSIIIDKLTTQIKNLSKFQSGCLEIRDILTGGIYNGDFRKC